jgi:hypothetical protein
MNRSARAGGIDRPRDFSPLGSRAIFIGTGVTLMLALAGCGSGAVSAPPPETPASPLAVSPPAADLFAEIPTTFTITGGRPGYTAFSSNNVALPIASSAVGASFIVTAAAVTADTSVDITVRDSANAAATAKTIIKPTTLNNQISITPVAAGTAGCGTAICSGNSAQVSVKAALNGVVLRNRSIRFDLVIGNFQFVTPGTGALVNSLTLNTDEQGEAVARLTVTPGAATQVATLRSTDTVSGLSRQYSFNIVQQTSGAGVLSTLPSGAVTIKGAKGAPGQDGLCPSGVPVDFYIFGGVPPYSVASPLPGLISVNPTSVAQAGGRFTATTLGCGKAGLIVTDASGRVIETAQIDAQQGDRGDPAPTPSTPTLIASPKSIQLGCRQSGTVSLAGNGAYSVVVVTPGVNGAAFSVSPTSGTLPAAITLTRSATSPAISLPATITVNAVAGSTIEAITVGIDQTPCTP